MKETKVTQYECEECDFTTTSKFDIEFHERGHEIDRRDRACCHDNLECFLNTEYDDEPELSVMVSCSCCSYIRYVDIDPRLISKEELKRIVELKRISESKS